MNRRLVVEADGGSRGNPGPAAYGAVVREEATGEALVELAGHLGVTTNNVAEYTGLLEGLRAAMEVDPDAHVEARLDSKLVVEQMSGRWAIKNDALRRLALQAREVVPRERVSFTWVPRERNKAADALANESMDAVERGRDGTIRRSATDAYETETEQDPVPPGPRPAVVGWGPDIGAPTVTLLVRHGVTQHSLERRFSGSGGRLDPPLVDEGRAQVGAAAAELVARGGADVLVCSPMLRTRQTAEILGRSLGLEPVVVDGLEEGRFGEWDGATFAEVMTRWPKELEAWLGSPDVAPPGGESLRDIHSRVGAALQQVLDRYRGARIAVAAHVGSIRALTAHALDAPLPSMNRMELAPASITTLTWYADGNASMRSFAETGHLAGLIHAWTP
ncbi:MAG: bifunctional RNase H/acid phosphatase [Actinobacteria bacterium]|nr:bifunctional RNase H/acid phosphatase [Actinomycetota bacterium]